MKKLFAYITFALYSVSAVAGLPPPSVKGQADTSALTKFQIQAPNSQITDLGGVNALVETGNYNQLANPSFEASTASTSWTVATATANSESTEVTHGKKSIRLAFSASTGSLLQSVTPTQKLDSQDLEYSMRVNTTLSGIQVCALQAGSEVGTCADVPSTGKWTKVTVNYPGPASGSIGVKVKATSSVTGNVYVDDAYVGRATNIASTQSATFYGSANYPSTSGCSWSQTASTTFANFSVNASCPTPTVTGGVTAPATKIPGIRLQNAPAGRYLILVNGHFYVQTASREYAARLTDGTTTFGSSSMSYADSAIGAGPTMSGGITYTTAQSDITIQVQAAVDTSTGTLQIDASTGGSGRTLTFQVYYFPTTSQQAVRMDQSDISWTAYTPTFTALGTPTAVDFWWARVNDNLLIRGKFTTPGSGLSASEARISFPNSLVADATKVASIQAAGRLLQSAANPVGYSLMESGAGYLTLSYQAPSGAGNFAGLTKQNGSGFGTSVTFSVDAVVPISGWSANQNAPLLVGGVTSSSAGMERVERVMILSACSTSPCTLTSSTPGIASVTRTGTGGYNVNFTAGIFSAAPTCVFSCVPSTANACLARANNAPTALVSSAAVINTATSTNVDEGLNAICMGPR